MVYSFKWFPTRTISFKYLCKFFLENWITVILSLQKAILLVITSKREHKQSTPTKNFFSNEHPYREKMQHKLQAKLRLLVRNSYLIREADFPEWCLKTKRNDRTLTMQDHHGSRPYCISWQTGRYCYKYDLNQTADQQFSSKQWLAGLRVCGCAFSLRMTLRKHSSHCHLRFSKDWGLSTHCWLTWRTSRNRPLSNCVRTKEQRRG